jgi:hypothetical protein
MSFKILISVETPEELTQSLSKMGKDLDAGKFPAVVNELTYLSWEHMLSIFTPEGKAIMEDFKRIEEEGPDATGCDFIGLLSESTDAHVSLEEINEAISQGWSGSDKDESIDFENTDGKSRFKMKLHH